MLYHIVRLFGISDKDVSVLMYHSVDEVSGWKYGVYPDEFRKQMEYLSRCFHVVPLKDVLFYMQGKKDLPDRSIALTFDDGYKDTYTEVFPILKQYKFPATVFLTTDLREKTELGNLRRPSWDEIKEMHESGLLTFEVHGHEHKNLKKLCAQDPELFKRELETCRRLTHSHTGYMPRFVAYAFGHKDRCVIESVKQLGYDAAFTINEGLVRRGEDIYTIRRSQVDRTMNMLQFKIRLTGALDIHRKLINAVRGSYGKWR